MLSVYIMLCATYDLDMAEMHDRKCLSLYMIQTQLAIDISMLLIGEKNRRTLVRTIISHLLDKLFGVALSTSRAATWLVV